MNKKIKNINQYIRNGNLLEENIPQLFNHLANHYQTYAGVGLAMHYYAFYEAYCDEEDTWSEEAKNVAATLNNIIKDNILKNQSGLEREVAIKTVDNIRKDITKRMNLLTAYTDIFQTYEYILNRIEYRFKEELEPVDAMEFSKEILRYIFVTEDNLIINEKIKDIIGQLPIRITKQKYFDLLKDSLRAYLGSDSSSLETYLYMLRTSAMLYNEEGMDSYYPSLWEKKDFLSHLEYKNITRQKFDQALSTLQVATLTLETETTVYFGLQEIVNEVYAILLSQTYAGMVVSDTEEAGKAAFSIIRDINDIFIINEKKELSIDLMEKFTDIEGVQEELSFDIAALEDALYEVDINHRALAEGIMADQLLNVLLRAQKLLSNSMFINLEGEKEEETVDEDMVEKETKALIDELTLLFAEHDKVICRAVIANTINKMPVFFKDHKEVMDYVCYSFERCSDTFEKAACVEIINAIMAE
ncbi:MAG: hypothetical protein ACYDEX_13635 [Mobilitalea sp.]